jgi:hypothetical protein
VRDPGTYAAISDTEYHADRDSLSSSGARKILQSPARFRWDMDHPRPYVAAFELGHAAHTLTLGIGDEFEVVDADSWRAKESREQRDLAIAEGRTPLLASEWRQVQDMREALADHPVAGPLFERDDTMAELSMWWEDPDTGCSCRARPDLATYDWDLIVDYKTTADASPRGFQKAVATFSYEVQAAWYLDAVSVLKDARDVPFVFVCQEKTPPYLVGIYQLDVEALRVGAEKSARARRLYVQATASDQWPGYPTAPQLIDLPKWAVIQHDEDQIQEQQ